VIGEIITTTAMRQIANLINNALRYDPAAQRAIDELSGTQIVIESLVPPCRAAVLLDNGQVSLALDPVEAGDITLSGNLVSMIALALKMRSSTTLAGSGVKVSGDTRILQQLSHALEQLDIDWEAALADVFGDVAAHAMGSAIRSATRSIHENSQRIVESATEVAQEEWRLTPSMAEFEHFSTRVRRLAVDVERLDARVARLLQRIEK
jgi:ubiquinone biosynthesis protein UbiJ